MIFIYLFIIILLFQLISKHIIMKSPVQWSQAPGCQTLNSLFKASSYLMGNDVCRFRVIPPFAVIFPLWWKGQLYSNVKYIYKYFKRDEICNVSTQCTVSGDISSRLLREDFRVAPRRLQQASYWQQSPGLLGESNPIFKYWNIEIIQYLTHGVWGAGDVQWVLMLFPKPVVFRAVHTSYWILVKNECCKMEVNNLRFQGSQGHSYPSLRNENSF